MISKGNIRKVKIDCFFSHCLTLFVSEMVFDSLVESTGTTTYPAPVAIVGPHLNIFQKDRNVEKALKYELD